MYQDAAGEAVMTRDAGAIITTHNAGQPRTGMEEIVPGKTIIVLKMAAGNILTSQPAQTPKE